MVIIEPSQRRWSMRAVKQHILIKNFKTSSPGCLAGISKKEDPLVDRWTRCWFKQHLTWFEGASRTQNVRMCRKPVLFVCRCMLHKRVQVKHLAAELLVTVLDTLERESTSNETKTGKNKSEKGKTHHPSCTIIAHHRNISCCARSCHPHPSHNACSYLDPKEDHTQASRKDRKDSKRTGL